MTVETFRGWDLEQWAIAAGWYSSDRMWEHFDDIIEIAGIVKIAWDSRFPFAPGRGEQGWGSRNVDIEFASALFDQVREIITCYTSSAKETLH